ncbi:MAG TPA: T6SS amidase immunity protein Tai4 family protein [Bryobacteraceae bacterium]|nr:T6SS amidase immunity protein Tai4 family protein [Bryobacteraceae bacterium]
MKQPDHVSGSNGGLMDSIRKISVVFTFLIALAFVAAPATDARVKYSPVQYLRNFALSKCIADGYTSEEVAKDSLAAAGGYLELGSLPMEAYEEAASLGKKFLAKNYPSKSGAQLTLMKCIDFFYSEELQQVAKKYAKK